MRQRDRRYGTWRWRRLAKSVVVTPGYFLCWRPECFRPATVADHIVPVYPGMSDAEFYSGDNLRPSCDGCNKARGLLAGPAQAEPSRPKSLAVRSFLHPQAGDLVMTPDEMAQAERAADAEFQRQVQATTPEQRSHALYVAVRAFQAALAIEGANVTDHLVLLHLLDSALDEYGEGLDPRRD